MANDWLKMLHDLPEKPETIAISSETGIEIFSVVGRLHRVWTWFDRHTTDGSASGVTPEFLDSLVAHEGFAAAMISVRWLAQRNGRIAVPKFDRHNSKSAKARALSAERMKRSRYKTSVTEPSPEQSNQRTEKDSVKDQRPEGSGSGVLDAGKVTIRKALVTTEKASRAGDLTIDSLRDPNAFRLWVVRERRLAHGLVKSDDGEALAFSGRAKALSDATLTNPVGWVKSTLELHAKGETAEAWSRVNGKHEDAASKTKRSIGSTTAELISPDACKVPK